MTLPFANRRWVWLLGAVTLAAGLFTAGYRWAERSYLADIARQQASYAQQQRQQAEAQAEALVSALRDKQQLEEQAYRVGVALLQARADLARNQAQLSRRIAHVVQQDGERFTGLGPDSLRLYLAALGYTSDDAHLPAADPGIAVQADQTATAAGGLPPLALLYHAADYGRWCQQLEQQLDAWQALFPPTQGEAHAGP
ncbi:hypothetical protein DLM_1275 [Aquitalea magnusonii]|uniref:Uncharacterized protein n=1 Tax=Aquitalea magnusonii TaxID=332411 RepID=A0A3G9GE10_9NEIS|nr:hypothetical protein [Aquitalea magnusonii]BBF84899.1 hypothetical protein DLM_1275 [Aquitalea magnusonii]